MKYIIDIPDNDMNITKKDEVVIRSGDNFTITGNISNLKKYNSNEGKQTAMKKFDEMIDIIENYHGKLDELYYAWGINQLFVSIAYSLAKIADKE